MRIGGAICAGVLFCAVFASAWVDQTEASIRARRGYWVFQRPVRPDLPDLQSAWIHTPIDALLLDAMRQKGLVPSRAIDRTKLIRRVTLDLTGLPPTPGEVDLFL